MRILVLTVVLMSILQIPSFVNAQGEPWLVSEIQLDEKITELDWHPTLPLVGILTSNNSSIMIFDVDKNEIKTQLESNREAELDAIDWSASGDYIAGLFGNYDVVVWDFETAQIIHSISLYDVVERSLFVSLLTDITWGFNDEQLVIANDGDLTFWNLESGEITNIPTEIYKIDWLPEPQRFVGFSTDGTVYIETMDWTTHLTMSNSDLYSSRKGLSILDTLPIDSIQIDGSILVAFGENDRSFQVHNIVIFNITTGELAGVLNEHQDLIWEIRWSPDGQFLASSSGQISHAPNEDIDNSFHIYDAGTLELVYSSEPFSSAVTSISWSSDSSQLAVSTWDGKLQIWDVSALN